MIILLIFSTLFILILLNYILIKNSKIRIIYNIFIVIFFLYQFSFYLFYNININFGYSFINTSKNNILNSVYISLIYSFILFLSLIIFTNLKIIKYNILILNKNINYWMIILFILTNTIFLYAYFKGAYNEIYHNKALAAVYSTSYLFLNYTIIYMISVISVNYSLLSRIGKIIFIFLIIEFIIMHILIMNRKEILFLLLIFFTVYINKYKPTIKIYLFSIILLFILFIFGFIREMEDFTILEFIRVISGGNEFIMPIQTLFYAVFNSIHSPEHIFSSLTSYIPSFIYPNKIDSIGAFINGYFKSFFNGFTVGFASTPVTEAFIIYNYYFILHIPFVILIIIIFSKLKNSLILVLGMSFEYARGELLSIVVLIIYFSIAYLFTICIINLFNKRKKIQ
jgi:hypothetical protein